MKVLHDETVQEIEKRLDVAKTNVMKSQCDPPDEQNYYWGGYVAALNFVLERIK